MIHKILLIPINKKTMKTKLKFLIALVLLLSLSFKFAPSSALAWFGAGRTPGWDLTTTGLAGEIKLPSYKFAPDFYRVGDTVSITSEGFNNNTTDVTAHYYMAVNRVLTINGEDVTDGDPDAPGINENDLRNLENSGAMTQELVALIDLGEITFPANGSTSLNASYTTNATGYYQFDFIDINLNQDSYQPGHILTAGFFRVLANTNPIEPTPTPTVEPTVEPTTAPVGQASSAMGYNGPTCTNNEFEVTMDLKDANGNGAKDVLVTFTYRNEKKEARTNNDGRARVFYSFSGEDSVEARADGFATQHVFIKAAQSCPVTGGSSSTSSNNNTETRSNGQVLGASTLAETGMNIWQQALVLGLILSTISSVSLVKNRK